MSRISEWRYDEETGTVVGPCGHRVRATAAGAAEARAHRCDAPRPRTEWKPTGVVLHTRGIDIGDVGSRAVLVYADGSVRGEGKVISHSLVPSVCVETDRGERIWWRHDMGQVVAGPVEE